MRFMLGFTQAFSVIYGPVWVNEFSPRDSNTKWMAILHSFAVIGVMIGYIFGAITVNALKDYLSWRFAFMLQGWFMILIGIFFLFCDNNALDIFTRIQQRPKSFSNAHRDNLPIASGDNTPSQSRSALPEGGRTSNLNEHRKSIRMDTISL